ncbi:ZIP family metal transporter [Salinibacterium sp. ZJ450]|uniref:ZIP family metal transporter n=1 Tax=Salinibacterium sp. ZJ450 TaxID=2708338 RepID=UPI0014223E31|nr:zinc permease [Salinibacterium sp. ZJ450]
MATSLLFGVVASGALLLGAFVGARFQLPKRLLAVMLSFAAGALISALTFELFEDAYHRGGIVRAAIGLFVGAGVFIVLSALLDRWAQAGPRPKPAAEYHGSAKLDTDAAALGRAPTVASTQGAAGLALLAAATLDGVPENLALGVSLSEGGGAGGLALLIAIFVANFPEGLVSAASMRSQGWSTVKIMALWFACFVLLVVAVVVGASLLADTDPKTISLPLAFAAGAVIAALSDTIMPEAYENGGPAVALSTAAGFVLSFVLSLA